MTLFVPMTNVLAFQSLRIVKFLASKTNIFFKKKVLKFKKILFFESKLSAMEDPIALPRQVLSALRTGRIELEWKMLPNQVYSH